MYSQQVPVSFRITMASLGPQVTVDPSSDNRNTVMLVHEKDGEFALCTLIPCKQEQQPLDIVLKEGDTIHLRVHGENPVHLVGYYIDDMEEPALGDEYDSEMMSEGESLNSDNMESEEEDSELDEYEREPGETDESEYSTSEEDAEFSDEDHKVRKERKNKPKISVVDSDGETLSEDEDDEDDEEDDSEDDSAFDSEDDEEIDSDEIDSDDYSSDLDSDEMDSEEDDDEDDDDDSEGSEEESEEEEVAPKRKADAKPAANLSPKKAKVVEASPAAKKPVETPKAKESTPVSTPTQKSKEQTPKATPTQQPQQAKSKEATPQGAKKENVKPAAASPASANMASKTLQGGVTVQDVSLGEGIKAQKGRQVTISYTLDGKQANAQFVVGDMSQTIRGLDTGIIGMALGGQRKVVIPAAALQEGEGKALAGLPKNKDVTLTVKLEKVVNLK
jgi:FK506-binding nuclear protein